jgi:VanZ family protein
LFDYLKKNKKLLVFTPLVVYWIVLLAATSIPAASMPSIGVADKLNHFLAYFVLSVLLFLTLLFQEKFDLSLSRIAIYTFLISTVYGVLDEVHQMFIPGRSAEFLDWVADSIGGGLGVLLMMYLVRKTGYYHQK